MNKTNKSKAGKYIAAGKQIQCCHCGGTDFIEGRGEVNPSGKTFLGMELSSKWVSTLACTNCGRIEWFLKSPEKQPI